MGSHSGNALYPVPERNTTMKIQFTSSAAAVAAIARILGHGCALYEADFDRLIQGEVEVDLLELNRLMEIAGKARNERKTQLFGMEGWETDESGALVHTSQSGRVTVHATEEKVVLQIRRGGFYEGRVALELTCTDHKWSVTQFEEKLFEGRSDVLQTLKHFEEARSIEHKELQKLFAALDAGEEKPSSEDDEPRRPRRKRGGDPDGFTVVGWCLVAPEL